MLLWSTARHLRRSEKLTLLWSTLDGDVNRHDIHGRPVALETPPKSLPKSALSWFMLTAPRHLRHRVVQTRNPETLWAFRRALLDDLPAIRRGIAAMATQYPAQAATTWHPFSGGRPVPTRRIPRRHEALWWPRPFYIRWIRISVADLRPLTVHNRIMYPPFPLRRIFNRGKQPRLG